MPAGQPRNVGIICCMHPDEEKSRRMYQDLLRIDERYGMGPGIQFILGNELAYDQGLRYSEGGVNLNLVFPGDPDSPIYEVRRAAELFKWAQQFDIVLDIHGNRSEGYDCVMLQPEANLTVRGIARYLGFSKVVLANKGTLAGNLPHVALIELSPKSPIYPGLILKLAQELARGSQHIENWQEPYQWYQDIGIVPRAQAMAVYPHTIPPFTPLSQAMTQKLGLHPQAHALGWSHEMGDPEIIMPTEDPWHTRYRARRAMAS